MNVRRALESRLADRDLLGRRTVSLLLVGIIHLLGFLLLLSLAPNVLRRVAPELKSFPLLSISEEPAPKVAATSSAPRRQVKVTPPTPPTTPEVPKLPSNIIWMTSEQFRATDISKFAPREAKDASGTGGAATAEAQGAGEGPGGQKLYPADWYREPTLAEIAFYQKDKRQAGWGVIACRSAPQFRVEDCQEIAEFPKGSGLASAMRQASWQFRVRPPMIGGKPQFGAWIKITFDYEYGVMK